MIKTVLIAIFLFFLLSFAPTHAQSDNSFVTIVNPQRISEYTKNYLESFKTQLAQIESRGLSATWPVTYDVLTKKDFVSALNNMSDAQELGIFLEVTPNLAKDTGVTYNQSDSWHRANSLFTTGYTQGDRIKLIDTVFKKFKEEFGYYPTSVGAWYIDSFSLSYMQKKYGITATINMSDQYDLDGYKLWGTPWSAPYYPSKTNAAMPGNLDVLTLRWASRDPLNGYTKIGTHEPSLYSLQDYSFIGLPNSYYEDLLKTFAIQNAHNDFGHATVGLEGDLSPEAYSTHFAEQMDIVLRLQNQEELQVMTMQDFSAWHKESTTQKIHIIESTDLTKKTNKKAYWVQTPNYRVGIVYDPETNLTSIIDLRVYYKNLVEPHFSSPGKQFNLSLHLPYVIDTVAEPGSKWILDLGVLKNIENGAFIFEKGKVMFKEDEVVFPKVIEIPDSIKSSPYLKTSRNILQLNIPFPTPENGQIYLDASLEIPFTIKRRLPNLIVEHLPKLSLPAPLPYSISQSEMDALQVLKNLPKGNVLVYDRDCFDCAFHSEYKPAAMAGKKEYVTIFSGKQIAEDFSFSTATTSNVAKQELKNKEVKYIYLAKYEEYAETLPYLPQDLGLKKVYENANAEIWEVK